MNQHLNAGLLWPDPLIQLNPSFEPAATIEQLVAEGALHEECARVFQRDKQPTVGSAGLPLRLHRHQEDGIRLAIAGRNYVLTTGTASGKSLSYIVPIVDHVLRGGSGKGIQAIIVYPMNALANSQAHELEKFLCYGYDASAYPVRFARYTGQESGQQRQDILTNPPDILLTNYVMLELILTAPMSRNSSMQRADCVSSCWTSFTLIAAGILAVKATAALRCAGRRSLDRCG